MMDVWVNFIYINYKDEVIGFFDFDNMLEG